MFNRNYNGKVVALKSGAVTVEIAKLSQEEREANPKTLEFITTRNDLYVGKEVEVDVIIPVSHALIVWCYIVPVILSLSAFWALTHATGQLWLSLQLAIFTLIPYYSILWVIGSSRQKKVRYILR